MNRIPAFVAKIMIVWSRKKLFLPPPFATKDTLPHEKINKNTHITKLLIDLRLMKDLRQSRDQRPVPPSCHGI